MNDPFKIDPARLGPEAMINYVAAVNLRSIAENLQYGNRNFSRHRLRIFGGNVTLAQNATGNISIQLGSSNAWVVESWAYQSTGAFNAQVETDNPSDEKICFAQYPGALLFGTGLANEGIRPFRVKASSRLNIVVTDTSGAQNTIYLITQCRAIDAQLDAWAQGPLNLGPASS